MPRLLLGILVVIGMINAAALHSQQSDYEKEEVKKYKIRKATLTISNQDAQGKTFLEQKWVKEYDMHGDLTETVGYTGRTEIRWQYKYDAREHLTAYLVDGATKEMVSYKYDSDGQISSMTVFNSDGSVRENLSVARDSKGRVVEEKSFAGNGTLVDRHTYKYDSSGNKIEYADFGPSSNLILKNVNSFNSQGYVTQILTYGAPGSEPEKTIFVYGTAGHLLEQTAFAPNGSVRTHEKLERDPAGFVIRSVKSDATINQTTITRYEYDFYQ
jgi:hypothetical protein